MTERGREGEREEDKEGSKKVGRIRGKKEQARDSSVMVSHAWSSIFNEAKVNIFSCSFTRRRNPNHAKVNLFKQPPCHQTTATRSTPPSLPPGPTQLLLSSAIHLHSLTESPASFHRNSTLTESDSCHQTEKRNLEPSFSFALPSVPPTLC